MSMNISLHNVGIIAIIVFSLINLAIGLYQKRNRANVVTNYVSYANQAGPFMVVLSVTSTIAGGGMFFAVSQLGFETGISGIYLGLSYFFGLVMLGGLAPLIRKKMSESNATTLYEFIDARFPPVGIISLRKIFALSTLVIFFMFLGAQVLTLSFFISHIYELSSQQSITASATVIFVINTSVYVFLGGLQKDIITDIFQMLLVLVGVALIIYSINDIESIKNLDDEYFIGTKAGPVLLIGIVLFIGPALLVRPDMWQRIIASKTDAVAKWSFWIAAILSMFIFWVFTAIGMYANVEGWENGDTALFNIIKNGNGTLYSLIMVAFLSAVISSADTFLNICSISVAELLKKPFSERSLSISTLRISSLIASFLALFVAFSLPDLIDLFAGGFGALFVFMPMIYDALFSSHLNSRAANYSALAGMLIYFAFVFVFPREAFLPALIVSTSVYYVMLSKDKKTDSNKNV